MAVKKLGLRHVNDVIKRSRLPHIVKTRQDPMYGTVYVLYEYHEAGMFPITESTDLTDLMIKTGLGDLFGLSY